MIANVCKECGEWFRVGETHACRAERRDGMADARKAGLKHYKQHPIAVMIVGGNIQAVAFGKVLFETCILKADGHDIFAKFLETWVEAGIDETGC